MQKAEVTRLAEINTRKVVIQVEDVLVEGEKSVPVPLRKAAVCIVFKNPWAGRGFVDDLWDDMNPIEEVLAHEIGTRLLDIFDGPEGIQGTGKAAIVGTSGEVEHGAGLLHGPLFSPTLRPLIDSAGMSSTEQRSGPGTTISIPTVSKVKRNTRDFYQGVEFALTDAPYEDEIAVVVAAVSGPRPHARVGDLSTDAEWMERRKATRENR